MSAIVTTASSIKALVITRSLGRRGIGVITGDKQRFALASCSRYSTRSFRYPSPVDKTSQFIESLVQYVRTAKPEVLIPTHSEDTSVIAKHKHDLEHYVKVPIHEYPALEKANDKAYVSQLALELGIPTPKTFCPGHLDELRYYAEVASLPAVIKLRSRTSSVGISYANTEDELLAKYKTTVSRFALAAPDYPLIQEYVPGVGYGVSLLFNRGELRAKFTHKRLREYPVSGGPSTYRVSVEHPEMEDMAIKLLKYLDWHGVVMIEFKLDERTNTPTLIEINPRFWGSLNQAICSGVDFPYLLYRMAVDGDVEPVLTYKLGVKTRVLLIDYVTLLYQLWNSPRKWSTLKELFHFCPDDIISVTDPLPTVGFLYDRLRR